MCIKNYNEIDIEIWINWTCTPTDVSELAQVPISSSQILLEIQPFDVSPQKGVFKVTIL